MRPGALIGIGIFASLVGIAAELLSPCRGAGIMVIWAGAALFGKGYGTWEERERMKP